MTGTAQRRRRAYSLRGRLLALLIGLMAVLWLGSALLAFQHAVEEVDALFDAQMVQASDLLLEMARDIERPRPAGDLAGPSKRSRLPIFYQVMDGDGLRWRLLAHSPTAPDMVLLPEQLAEGFSRVEAAGLPWRIFVRQETEGPGRHLRVVVGQRYSIRDDLAHEFAEHLAIPLGMAFPVVAIAIWWAVSRATRPVRAAARSVVAMQVDNLRPIDLADRLPEEIAPLIEAINTLTARVAGAIESERRFTADAAHELRTPLAALKVQAQVAMKVGEPELRQHALGQVLVGVERMHHLVEQLLALARLDPAAAAPAAGRSTDLADAAALACAELAPRAMARRQEVQLLAGQPARARIDDAWALALIRNLVDNALRYGEDGGRVEVGVVGTGQGVELSVRDDGPGVAAENRGRLLERFYRAADADAEGCGLGLSIVARIAESASARIDFVDGLARADGGVGLGVRVAFPPA